MSHNGPAQEIDWFRDFVTSSRWQFAKTYVESYPHEWTHQRSCRPEDFTSAIECIERWGVVEAFWGSRRRYLHVDGRQYWHMGNASSNYPAQRPTLINRAWIEVGKYRDDARALGYDGERLERLVDRWTVLLEKAHRGG